MTKNTLFLFGEAEKGTFGVPIRCQSLGNLIEHLGNPPKESQGIHYAIQAILYQWNLLFFRVREEGFSKEDYMSGIKFLQSNDICSQITALCMPGVGDQSIIDATNPLCLTHKILLILTDKDLYDYMTSKKN